MKQATGKNWNQSPFFLVLFTLALLLINVWGKNVPLESDSGCQHEDAKLCRAVCGDEEPTGCVEAPTDDDFNFYCICQNKVSKVATYEDLDDDIFCSPAKGNSTKNGCSCPVTGHLEKTFTFDCHMQDYEMCACAFSTVEWVEAKVNYDEDFDTEGDTVADE